MYRLPRGRPITKSGRPLVPPRGGRACQEGGTRNHKSRETIDAGIAKRRQIILESIVRILLVHVICKADNQDWPTHGHGRLGVRFGE